MAQTTQITIDNQTFPSFRSKLNESLSALNTLNSGTSRPSSAAAGTIWLDTTNATNPTLKFYDGADDISLATIDYSANTVNWLDSSVSLTSPVAVSGNATAGAEIRLPEDTDNGSNYVALKAADSIASDVTFTLPSADGTADQVLKTDGSGNLSFTDVSAGLEWQSVQTTGFTASAGNAYPCNTTSAGFTVTLPTTPSAGDQIQLLDYAGTFDSNSLTIDPNGNNIEGSTSNLLLNDERISVTLTYVDSTQGWLVSSGANEGNDALKPTSYSIDFLVIAGGGSGGTYDGSASVGNNGSDSSISGSGLTTITSTGGGGGGAYNNLTAGNGGSGGGGASNSGAGGTGNTPSTSPSQGNDGGDGLFDGSSYFGGGGGGASAVGEDAYTSNAGDGGNGTASSITGSSVTRAGGGGGCKYISFGGNNGSGGTGGGGDGGTPNGVAGTANTGGGGGAGDNGIGGHGGGGAGGYRTSTQTANIGTVITVTVGDGGAAVGTSGAGGKGVVILSVPTSNYSSTTTGSPTVTTSGSDTIMQFNGSGSYTA